MVKSEVRAQSLEGRLDDLRGINGDLEKALAAAPKEAECLRTPGGRRARRAFPPGG